MTKILLVEDDKTIVANLTEFLNNEGYIVRSVTGQTAAMNTQATYLFISALPEQVSKEFLAYTATTEALPVSEIENVGIYTNFKFIDDKAFRVL